MRFSSSWDPTGKEIAHSQAFVYSANLGLSKEADWPVGAIKNLAIDLIWTVDREPLGGKNSKSSVHGKPAVQATGNLIVPGALERGT